MPCFESQKIFISQAQVSLKEHAWLMHACEAYPGAYSLAQSPGDYGEGIVHVSAPFTQCHIFPPFFSLCDCFLPTWLLHMILRLDVLEQMGQNRERLNLDEPL